MTIGIDLGDRRSHFCVLNDHAQVYRPRVFCPRRSQLSLKEGLQKEPVGRESNDSNGLLSFILRFHKAAHQLSTLFLPKEFEGK